MSATPPIALTVAGSDPSGGAGIQADLKTFTALGVYGASVTTALTAQNTRGVTGVMKVPVDFIVAQFDAVTSDLAIGAVKTGMLADAETVACVSERLGRLSGVPIVVDPVMVATSGDRLLDESAIAAVRERLVPLAALITPNLPEAAALLATGIAQSEAEMIAQAEELLQLGCGAVLVKGGHGAGSSAVDFLATRNGDRLRLSAPRISTRNTHGTGCTLAAAIAAKLAAGASVEASLENSVRAAKDFVWSAISSAATQQIGKGDGPVDHLFSVRNPALES